MLEAFEIVAKAIADTSRLRILKLLEDGELCVCQLTAVLDLAPATVSKHLSVLRSAGLLFQRKEGRWVYYRLADRAMGPHVPVMLAAVRTLGAAGDVRLDEDRRLLAAVKELPLQVLCDPNAAALRDLRAPAPPCCGPTP